AAGPRAGRARSGRRPGTASRPHLATATELPPHPPPPAGRPRASTGAENGVRLPPWPAAVVSNAGAGPRWEGRVGETPGAAHREWPGCRRRDNPAGGAPSSAGGVLPREPDHERRDVVVRAGGLGGVDQRLSGGVGAVRRSHGPGRVLRTQHVPEPVGRCDDGEVVAAEAPAAEL